MKKQFNFFITINNTATKSLNILVYKLYSRNFTIEIYGDNLKINMSECGVCEACVEVCPLRIIKKDTKIIIAEGCDNYGECLKVCPTGCMIPDEE
ncbi:hypothetical protein ALNOE001_09210 [Candidatus Methanobinarius endosymbioticus]|uniref:4Fe-4S ferredoxin-type domain-containing protein n=1 Tax=Candidatus Methanobinarius endosymbioticus TaxID=2006182 RepID=A0A366MAW9_9EURY|nr:hypothetical protein ALNOE001_09210 [Candidatus Methanobinarius endosymbioticus]